LIGMFRFSSKWILSHSTWYKSCRSGHTLSSPVQEKKNANWRAFREDFSELRRVFATLQTVWRRERDSNSRYGFGLQSLDVSVSCREENLSREFHIKIRRESLLRGDGGRWKHPRES
jgi:hypothetical protein